MISTSRIEFPSPSSSNGVDLRRAGDVNPLICCVWCENQGTYVPRSPVKFLKSTPLLFERVGRWPGVALNSKWMTRNDYSRWRT